MKKIQIIYFLLLISFLLLIRIPYLLSFSLPLSTADTFSYFEIGQHLLSQNFLANFINDHRTPLYPLLMGSVMHLTPNYDTGAWNIVFIQETIAIISLLYLYVFLIKNKLPSVLSFLFTLFIGANILLFGWDRTLLTESLAISWMIVTAIWVIQWGQKPNLTRGILLGFLSISGFLLRPAFIGVPLIFTVWVLIPTIQKSISSKTESIREASKERSKFSLTTKATVFYYTFPFIVYGMLTITYLIGNFHLHNYRGINHIADINILGVILKENLPVEGGKSYPFFYNAVIDGRKKNVSTMPYRFLETYDREIYIKPDRLNELQGFTRSVLWSTLPLYLSKSLMHAPEAILEREHHSAIELPSRGVTSLFYSRLSLFFHWMLFIPHIFLWTVPISFWMIMKNKSLLSHSIVLSGLISWYMIAMGIFFDYGEYGRIVGIAQPFFYWYSFGIIYSLYKSVILRRYV